MENVSVCLALLVLQQYITAPVLRNCTIQINIYLLNLWNQQWKRCLVKNFISGLCTTFCFLNPQICHRIVLNL